MGKPQNNKPFNNEIPAIKYFLLSPSVVNFIVKIFCYNKHPAIKNKIFGPFRLVKARFQCMLNLSYPDFRVNPQFSL
jgi:hypothetical protein